MMITNNENAINRTMMVSAMQISTGQTLIVDGDVYNDITPFVENVTVVGGPNEGSYDDLNDAIQYVGECDYVVVVVANPNLPDGNYDLLVFSDKLHTFHIG